MQFVFDFKEGAMEIKMMKVQDVHPYEKTRNM